MTEIVIVHSSILSGRVKISKNKDQGASLRYIRPQLEFSLQLRSPLEVKCQPMLDVVQSRATEFIVNNPKNIQYKESLNILNISPSEVRQNMKDFFS